MMTQHNAVKLTDGFEYSYDPAKVNVWATCETVKHDGRVIQKVHNIKVIVPVEDGEQEADVPVLCGSERA